MLKICEIVRLQSMALVAEMPTYLRGVIDLHGKWVPVVDLRAQPAARMESADCIVITECNFNSENPVEVGLIVDALDQISHIEMQEEKTEGHPSAEPLEAATDSRKINDAVCAWSKMANHVALGDHN